MNQQNSDQIVNLRAAVQSLSEELLHQTKVFKAALSELDSAVGLSASDTLRAAYAKLARTNLVSPNLLASGKSVLTAEIIVARKVMDSLGSAVSAMMGINRCIPSLNEAKKAHRKLELSIHKEAVLATKNASREFYGQIMQVETAAGDLLEVRPNETLEVLVGVSMDSSIQDLMTWRAIDRTL